MHSYAWSCGTQSVTRRQLCMILALMVNVCLVDLYSFFASVLFACISRVKIKHVPFNFVTALHDPGINGKCLSCRSIFFFCVCFVCLHFTCKNKNMFLLILQQLVIALFLLLLAGLFLSLTNPSTFVMDY